MQKYRFNFKRILILFIAVLGFGQYAMAVGTTYYAKLSVAISSSSPTGAGTVYLGNNETQTTQTNSSTNDQNVQFALHYKKNNGFEFIGWSNNPDGDENNIIQESKVNPWNTTVHSESTDEEKNQTR